MQILLRKRPIQSVIIAVTILLQGCATYATHKGVAATNLSGLRVGMQRNEVEQILGKPSKFEAIAQGTIAYYIYNRGYIPPIEAEDRSQIWTVPFTLFGDAITLGTAGYVMIEDEKNCQKGLLTVFYDTSGVLRLAKENVYSDDSILSSKRGNHCRWVMAHPRPSSLPDELKTATWPFEHDDGPD